MLSSPVLPGTIQLTPTGLIVLGPDAQTVGGYPRILQLDIQALTNLYQLLPGTPIRFVLE
ncbi:hypothetical protein A3850_015000 [Lewinella sp. 4G2]|nr:hypothetical protein A3850_015000 [Lewinella sp. 4G2]